MSQVGLRWWNFINDEGKSEWKFESRNSNDSTGCANNLSLGGIMHLFQVITAKVICND